MTTYLVKTEPSTYAFADLIRDKRTAWTGVSNPAALIHLRQMRAGDECFVYHTGDDKAIAGLAIVKREPYEDPERPGRTPEGEPKFAVVDLAPVRALKTPLTLKMIKGDRRFAEFALVKQSRLSVMPVPTELDGIIRELAGL